jgi:hypothetical protein
MAALYAANGLIVLSLLLYNGPQKLSNLQRLPTLVFWRKVGLINHESNEYYITFCRWSLAVIPLALVIYYGTILALLMST